jgi:hypothetical protein
MKKPFYWMVLLFFGASTLQQCSDPGESAVPEKVQFTWSLTDTGTENGRSKIDRVPDALILTVENPSGQTLLENHRIDLIRAGDAFISEPLSLTPGRYSITQFMLVAGENELLYAAPVHGAPLAPAVNRPLPFPINVVQGRLNRFDVEVLKFTEANFPEDFGYTSFTINDVNPLKISPFLARETGLTFTSATAYIIEGDDTIKTQPLSARINLFSFRGEDRNTVRKLVVTKPGYIPFVRMFRYIDFINELQGLPLEVIFEPAVFSIKPFFESEDGMLFQMNLAGLPGNLTVNWGDGAVDHYALAEEQVSLEHLYVHTGDYQMNIIGDLGNITYLYTFYGQGAMKSANFQALPRLKEIRMGWTAGPTVIDFSNNVELEFAMIPFIRQLKTVIPPKDGALYYLDISGPNAMTTADLDVLADRMSKVPVPDLSPSGHVLLLYKSFNIYDEMIGPPSPAALARLSELGWGVRPSL